MSESEFRKSHIPPANSMERGYLIDTSKPKQYQKQKQQSPKQVDALPPITGEIIIPEQATPSDLAGLLQQNKFKIIADLIGLGIMKTINQPLDFETISKIARKYGFLAKRAA